MSTQLRIGDAEREQAAGQLAEHFAVGRIDRAEHAERLDRIWAARTQADLDPVFADLPGQERDVARAAALLPRFDPALLSRATRTLDGSARRFTSRSLVTEDGHPLFPFRLHDAVRAAIAEEPLFADGAWSAVDRTHRAAALVEALRERHDENLESVEHRLDVVELAVG